MSEGNRERESSISRGSTVEEMGEFWDSHSLADHPEETAEVTFELRARRQGRIAPDPKVDPGSKQRR